MKGKFKPNNPDKYLGDPTEIIWRSSWELKLMRFLDSNKSILKWNSEEIIVPYYSPIDGKLHRYFPDFFVEYIDKDGKKEKMMVEIKPFKETQEPLKPANLGGKTIPTKQYINEVKKYGVNKAKWHAAKSFCEERGWKFQILTEVQLFK